MLCVVQCHAVAWFIIMLCLVQGHVVSGSES